MTFESPAVIIGSTGSIGSVVARQLREADVKILGAARNPPSDKSHWDEFCQVDISDDEAIRTLYQQAIGVLGVPRIIIHAAGRYGSPSETNPEEDAHVWATNYRSVAELIETFAGPMASSGGGQIVVVGSLAADIGSRSKAYAESKAGLYRLQEETCPQLARSGVTFNVVSPGPVDNAFFRATCDPERRAKHLAAIPMGRLATPADVAHAILFFASREAKYVTGSVLKICGGLA